MSNIYSTTGLDKTNLSHYCQNHCYVCGKSSCKNKVFDNVQFCEKYNPSKQINEWWINLKKAVYENETPWQDAEGNIDEGTDATSEMLELINEDADTQIILIECWATGDTPKQALDYWLKTMEP